MRSTVLFEPLLMLIVFPSIVFTYTFIVYFGTLLLNSFTNCLRIDSFHVVLLAILLVHTVIGLCAILFNGELFLDLQQCFCLLLRGLMSQGFSCFFFVVDI